jgi:hypothetical protein
LKLFSAKKQRNPSVALLWRDLFGFARKSIETSLCQMPSEDQTGATTIMVIRHAEKPDSYNGEQYFGVNAQGTVYGKDAAKHLVTLGWERAGGLVLLFTPPWGAQKGLDTPQFIYAADPDAKNEATDSGSGSKSEGPSRRPYETLTAVASKLHLQINTDYSKKHYDKMVEHALKQPGAVLICWQHEEIPLENADKQPGISQWILSKTGTASTLGVPRSWPAANGKARYDLVFVFRRPAATGPIASFAVIPQFLLPGDLGWPL